VPICRTLPGGVPYEFVVDVVMMALGGDIFAGAILEKRHGKSRVAEVMSKRLGLFARLPQGAEVLRRRPLTHRTLDDIVREFGEGPEEFRRAIERDQAVDFADVWPRAAVLARWGDKGARVVRHL